MRSEMFLTFLVLLGLITLIRLMARKNGPHFDERQLKTRGDAFQSAYYVLLIGCLSVMFLGKDGRIFQVMDLTFALYAIIMVSLVIFGARCIFGESFFAIEKKKKEILFLYCFLVIANIGLIASHIHDGTMFEGGRLTFSQSSSLINGIAFLALLICLFVKHLRMGREEAE